ncbi:Pentatricopeptide repeat [Macleaya cordata]|uniref:Pentatricopeptide repeat n=1 Tax=Macleaya cordata TaxID=56857 RepID=A0A200Q291_MACCD|nr:Pentatricopeptide repeat [Macleaya cordata]
MLRKFMEEEGLALDIHDYGALIDWFCRNGDMTGAGELFNELLLEVGLRPNLVIYNSLISGSLSQKNMDTALSLYERMYKEGDPPDILHYIN